MATPEELLAKGIKDFDSYVIGHKEGKQDLLNSMENSFTTDAINLGKIDGFTAFRIFHAIFQAQLDKEN